MDSLAKPLQKGMFVIDLKKIGENGDHFSVDT